MNDSHATNQSVYIDGKVGLAPRLCSSFLSISLLIILQFPFSFAGTVQDSGLPSPAGKEWLFANVTAGKIGDTEYEFCLEFSNPTPNIGQAELAFFSSTGEELFPERPSANRGSPPVSFTIQPHGGRIRCLSSSGLTFGSSAAPLPLPSGAFVGWAEVKTTAGVNVTGSLSTIDPDSNQEVTRIQLFGNTGPVQKGRFRFDHAIGGGTGLSLVNPFDETIDILLTIRIGSTISLPVEAAVGAQRFLSLAAKSQESLVINEILSEGFFVELEAEDSSPGFGFEVINFCCYSQAGTVQLSLPRLNSFGSIGDLILLQETSGTWDFPVEILYSTQLGEKWIGVTSFGFYVREPDGSTAFFARPGGQSLYVDPANQFALVDYFEGKELILPGQNRMLALPQRGTIRSIQMPDPDLLEILTENLAPLGFVVIGICRSSLVDLTDLSILEISSYLPNLSGPQCGPAPEEN